MKKIMIIAAFALTAICANAASFKWSAANIYGPDGNKYSGLVTIFSTQVDGWSATANAASGVVSATTATFSSDLFVTGNYYDFYFTIETAGKTFTSATINKAALDAQTQSVGFGNMQTATQATGAWVAVPEPTSGLLLLLGVAGLALKRKRA